jgi:hypothetical protein
MHTGPDLERFARTGKHSMRPRDWLLTAAAALGWLLVAHGVVVESVWLSRAGMLLALGSMAWLAVRGRRAPADPGREDWLAVRGRPGLDGQGHRRSSDSASHRRRPTAAADETLNSGTT